MGFDAYNGIIGNELCSILSLLSVNTLILYMSSTDSIFGVDFKAVPITTSIAKKLKLNIGNYDDKMIRLSFEDISSFTLTNTLSKKSN